MTKILIIEDNPDHLKIYSDNLKNRGYETLTAKTGGEGLHLAKNENPDLILLDIMLPQGMNGFDLLERISVDDRLKKIPVIVLTNLDSEKQMAMSMGVSEYLVKANISSKDVLDAVGKFVKP